VSVIPDRVVAAIAEGGKPGGGGKPGKNPAPEVVPSGVERIGASGLTFDGSGVAVVVAAGNDAAVEVTQCVPAAYSYDGEREGVVSAVSALNAAP